MGTIITVTQTVAFAVHFPDEQSDIESASLARYLAARIRRNTGNFVTSSSEDVARAVGGIKSICTGITSSAVVESDTDDSYQPVVTDDNDATHITAEGDADGS